MPTGSEKSEEGDVPEEETNVKQEEGEGDPPLTGNGAGPCIAMLAK